jgi:hypothetical protein
LAGQLYVFQSQMDWLVGRHFPFNPQWTGWWATPSLFQSPTDWPVAHISIPNGPAGGTLTVSISISNRLANCSYFNPQWTGR